MPKLFTKKQIFPFLASFFITLVIGFFIWNIFIGPDNGVMNLISSNFFPASLSFNSKIENITPAVDSEQEDSNNQGLESDKNLSVIQSPVIVVPESLQDQLDDIQEKLDIISQQVRELVAQQNQDDKLAEADEDKILDEESDDENDKNHDDEQKNDQDDEQNENIVTYLKILISEVQVASTLDDKQEFVELYNPNNQDINLTDWYLQRKTIGSSSWSTYASNNLFSGKIISANGYFLVARTGYYLGLADIFTDNPITNDNSFALKNPNGDISDKLGFGNAIDPELVATINPSISQSIGRKLTEQDTDNNSADFEIQTPTPKAQNITYTAPISGVGGGGSAVYPKILISEAQVAGTSDDKQEFVELYNPNTTDVILTGWYLQRKTSGGLSWSTYVSKNLFLGKSIAASSYFLIARNGYYIESADIFTDSAITDNNSFALKNPNGDISDKLGFGAASDFELLATVSPSAGQSIGRKILDDGTEQDTDNNSADFELQTSTPKAQNIKWVEPPIPILESIEITTTPTKLSYIVGDALDISGLIITGNYSDGTRQIETIMQEDITGFDSSSPVIGQILTIIFGEFTITYTVDINVPFDVPPSIIIFQISNQIISPNGDGYKDSTDIDFAFSEKVKANIDILNSSGIKVKDLYYSSGVENPDPKIWDGKDNSDALVLDGIYTIKVVITDSVNNSITDTSKTIIVDTTSPLITLSGDSEINLRLGDTYEEPGAVVFDLLDDTCAIKISGDIVNTVSPANFHVFYDSADLAGNNAEQVVRTVNVE